MKFNVQVKEVTIQCATIDVEFEEFDYDMAKLKAFITSQYDLGLIDDSLYLDDCYTEFIEVEVQPA